MSVQALGWVFDHSVAEKGERLVLLSLANHAHADGTDAYPSVATIMRETRLPERNVQYALKSLAEAGLIVRVGKAPDERIPGNRRPWNYRIVGVPPLAPQGSQGCKKPDSGVQESHSRGAADSTQTVPSTHPTEPGEVSADEEAPYDPLAPVDPETRRRNQLKVAEIARNLHRVPEKLKVEEAGAVR